MTIRDRIWRYLKEFPGTLWTPWLFRDKSTLSWIGLILAVLSGFGIMTFGILFLNWDPALAGPGAEDPRPFAIIALAVSVVTLLVGLLLEFLGRRRHDSTDSTRSPFT